MSRIRRAVVGSEYSAEITDTSVQLRAQHAGGELKSDVDGREPIISDFSRRDTAARLEQHLEGGLNDGAVRPKRARRRVAISGLRLFCAEIAQYTKQFTPEWEAQLLRTGSKLEVLNAIYSVALCDVWYSIGGPITDRWVHLAARLLRKPRVIHWVGSDIGVLAQNPGLAAALAVPNTTHLAEVSWTADQLREFGLNPRIVPLPPRHLNGDLKPMPAKFTVMLYVPRTRADFYGRRTFERLMRSLRSKPIRYIIVGGGEVEIPPGVDVENLGWKDTLVDAYEHASVLIRYTPRDGLSLMVLEALSFGRHVLWTHDFPHTRTIQTFGDMEREIVALFQRHERGELVPQVDAARMILEQYAPQTCMRDIAAAWNSASAAPANREIAVESP